MRSLIISIVLLIFTCIAVNAQGLEFRTTDNLLSDPKSEHNIGNVDRRSNDSAYGICSKFAPFLHAQRIVHVSGSITSGDDEAMRKYLDQLQPVKARIFEDCGDLVVSLNITGGSVPTAIEIGKIISERNIPTVVLSGNTCRSACLYTFVAGRLFGLFPESKLEIHFPRSSDAESLDKALGFQLKQQPYRAIESIRKDVQAVINQSHSFLVTSQRNPALFDIVSRSPVKASEFWAIDTYFELAMIGATTLTTAQNSTTTALELNKQYTSSVCAVEVFSLGLNKTLAPVTFEKYGQDAIIGLGGVFCFVASSSGVNGTDTHVCVFDSGTLNTTLKQIRNTPLSPWVNASGGWWPNNSFSSVNMLPSEIAKVGISKAEVAQFFREAMTGVVGGVALNGLFCRRTNSIASREVSAFGSVSEFNERCPNGLGFCRMRPN